MMMYDQLQAVRSSIVRPLAHSIVPLCVVYACVTRLVLRFTNSMLRALPVTPFSPCHAPGIHVPQMYSEGEPCIVLYNAIIYKNAVVLVTYIARTSATLYPKMAITNNLTTGRSYWWGKKIGPFLNGRTTWSKLAHTLAPQRNKRQSAAMCTIANRTINKYQALRSRYCSMTPPPK